MQADRASFAPLVRKSIRSLTRAAGSGAASPSFFLRYDVHLMKSKGFYDGACDRRSAAQNVTDVGTIDTITLRKRDGPAGTFNCCLQKNKYLVLIEYSF